MGSDTDQRMLSFFQERLYPDLITPPSKVRHIMPDWWWLKYAMAACLIPLVLLGGFFIYGPVQSTGKNTAPLSTLWHTELNTGQQTGKLQLPDGTVAWLSPGSQLSYQDGFGTNQRQMSLAGEVFFDVAHDKQHPFIHTYWQH